MMAVILRINDDGDRSDGEGDKYVTVVAMILMVTMTMMIGMMVAMILMVVTTIMIT